MSADDALLLIAHGSARFPDAAVALHDHAARLLTTRMFREVAIGLLNGAPTVTEAVAALSADRVRVVPFFMEEGFFTRVAVPRSLAGEAAAGRFELCPPVGVHDGMAGLIQHCIRTGCTARGLLPQATTVVIVGHGSARTPGQAKALHRHAAQVAATDAFASVTVACLEEPPFVADVLRRLRSDPVAVVGFFAGAGAHVLEDVPALIAAEQAARDTTGPKVHNFGAVTDSPAMLQIILDQAQSA